MKSKGYHTYAYAKDAKTDWKNKIDIITSFDVIEHVKDPRIYLKEVFELLSEDGQAIIGTPTDAPIMRRLLGKIYEMKLLWTYGCNRIFKTNVTCLFLPFLIQQMEVF